MLAIKGASAPAEVERDAGAIRRIGGGVPRVESCGAGIVDPPSTVVVVERAGGSSRFAADKAAKADHARRKRG
jgi:16S rRNA (guanine527-N7)-methyltransferase